MLLWSLYTQNWDNGRLRLMPPAGGALSSPAVEGPSPLPWQQQAEGAAEPTGLQQRQAAPDEHQLQEREHAPRQVAQQQQQQHSQGTHMALRAPQLKQESQETPTQGLDQQQQSQQQQGQQKLSGPSATAAASAAPQQTVGRGGSLAQRAEAAVQRKLKQAELAFAQAAEDPAGPCPLRPLQLLASVGCGGATLKVRAAPALLPCRRLATHHSCDPQMPGTAYHSFYAG